jgi:methylglutaconyl-CoA hydratase
VTDPSSHEVVVLQALDRRGVVTLTLNRPEKGNRYNQAMLDTLLAETARLGADPAVRVIVLRAGGKHFCVGAEIREEQRAAKEASGATIPALCLAFDNLPKPTIALVHGACIGGGVALVSCCDIVIAARDAFFSLPEVRLGFAPGPLIPFFLQAIEARSLRRYLLSGERFAADAAMRIGLVHELHDADGGDAALATLLDELLLAGPNAVGIAKGLLRQLARTPVSKELLAELQREFDVRRHSPEAAEGLASFREKRKPRWAAPEREQ